MRIPLETQFIGQKTSSFYPFIVGHVLIDRMYLLKAFTTNIFVPVYFKLPVSVRV